MNKKNAKQILRIVFISTDSNGDIKSDASGRRSLYLKAKSALTIKEGQKIKIRLVNFRGDPRTGTHSTRLLLKYKNLLHAGNSTSFSGEIKSLLTLMNS